MIEYHNSGCLMVLSHDLPPLCAVETALHNGGICATHIIMHTSVYEVYRAAVTPDTPEWAKSEDGKTIYAIEARTQLVWTCNGSMYPVVTDPDAPRNEIAFWRGGEKVAVIKDVATWT